MFVLFNFHVLSLSSLSIGEVNWWSECCLVIEEPRAGGGGPQRKDSLKDEYSSSLGHTCHLHSTFLLWVNAPSSVDSAGQTYNLCLLTWPPFPLFPSPHPPPLIWEHCRPPYRLWRHSFFGHVTIVSVNLAFINQIFIEHFTLPVSKDRARTQGQGL